jgi:hypothetical protein
MLQQMRVLFVIETKRPTVIDFDAKILSRLALPLLVGTVIEATFI